MRFSLVTLLFLLTLIYSCKENPTLSVSTNQLPNVLDYKISPENASDRSGLMFSDQGAWFAFGFPTDKSAYGGFSGPFLMTQENGVWSASVINQLIIEDETAEINWEQASIKSYSSHLEQDYASENLLLNQKLTYLSGHTALVHSTITNTGTSEAGLKFYWMSNNLLVKTFGLESIGNEITMPSTKSNAVGHLIFPDATTLHIDTTNFYSDKTYITLAPGESYDITTSQSFIFPEYSWKEELEAIENASFEEILKQRISEKETQIEALHAAVESSLSDEHQNLLLSKAQLTLQNNWRIPAGELKHAGLFPSYHYKWFNGFWSWDSWKHAVGLSYYNTQLAKDQMRAMFHFQLDNGFIVDCVYRDTSIEAHNFRDTKPPLAAWAVYKIFEKDGDFEFVKEFYPKLKKYHDWWYSDRDHDGDGLCEYGSTDGSLIAAKWESGMDNAIRFDDSKILKNAESAYSLDQESVDLNAYLYAEKMYLAALAHELLEENDKNRYISEAEALKKAIQDQFYDENDGWFYDTDLNGEHFIKGEGSEGWTALWAEVATPEQAAAVKDRMMNPQKFFTRVPFQTMSADHEKFDPFKGYWRGPNWLDQAYFGMKGLKNYGFEDEAEKAMLRLFNGAEGLLEEGSSIRENYHPLTGEGLNAQNFSWSGAHLIMMLKEI